jgi:tetratricopeptide (TPR) repeat protein
LAHVYVKQNRSRDAMQLLEAHVSKNAAVALIVADIAAELKQYDSGLGILAKIPRNLPFDDLYRLKARLYSDKGDFEAAIAVLRAARGPKRDDVEIALAEMLTFAGHRDEANEVYAKVLQVNPQDGNALLRRYNELMGSAPGNMLVAFSCAKLAAQLMPDNPDALDALATTYQYSQAEYKRSIEILEQAVAKAPQVSKYHYHLGQALMLSEGESTRALQEFHKALETNPSDEDRRRISQAINQLEMMHPGEVKVQAVKR